MLLVRAVHHRVGVADSAGLESIPEVRTFFDLGTDRPIVGHDQFSHLHNQLISDFPRHLGK
jgi:hypothetical protein